jgi:pimeloyl-ACP methyl ester carboxylesterase
MEEPHITDVAKAFNDSGVATLRVEMYGHGQSSGEFKDHTLYKWIENLFTVIEHTKTLNFVTDLYLCGHSQGGLLVMMVAGMYPDRIKALFPISPAWMIPEEARQGMLLGTPFDPVNIPETILQDGENLISGNYIRCAQTIHVEDEIKRFNGPVLIIHGAEDETVPYEYGVKAAKLYKNAKLVTIEGDTHCFDHHLDKVCYAIKEYLTNIDQ